MVSRVLHNEAYIGDSVHYRSTRPTHKSRLYRNKREDFLIVQNTHEPIIDRAVFEKVQAMMLQHYDKGKKHENILLQLVRCADCGKSMNFTQQAYHGKLGTTSRRYLTCYTYTKYGKMTCTSHHTRYDPLCKALTEAINEVITAARLDEEKVRIKLEDELKKQSNSSGRDHSRRLKEIEKRLTELIVFIGKLYEDRLAETLTEENFKVLTAKYQAEQAALRDEQKMLGGQIQEEIIVTTRIDEFICLCKNTLPIKQLTAETARAFIDTVVIHETPKVGRNKDLVMDIHFNFVGKVNFFN
jgi:flagellar motility protein MotE (MotC chaperone)